MNALLKAAAKPRIVKAALRVSLLVGTMLNLVNQGGRLLDGGSLLWLNVAANYIVPFCVSSYSAARNELAHRRS